MTRESIITWLRGAATMCFGTFRRTLVTMGAILVLMLVFDQSFRLSVYGVALDTLSIAFAILLTLAILSAISGKNLFWPKRKKSSSNRH